MNNPRSIFSVWILVCFTVFSLSLTSCYVLDQRLRQTWSMEGLVLTIQSPKNYYEVGETVLVEVALENTTDQAILLQTPLVRSAYVFDVSVEGVWLSSLYPELQVYERELGPHEKIELSYQLSPAQAELIPVDAYLYYDHGIRKVTLPLLINYGMKHY